MRTDHMVDIQKSFRTLKMTQVLTLRWTTHWALAKDIIVVTGRDEMLGADVDAPSPVLKC